MSDLDATLCYPQSRRTHSIAALVSLTIGLTFFGLYFAGDSGLDVGGRGVAVDVPAPRTTGPLMSTSETAAAETRDPRCSSYIYSDPYIRPGRLSFRRPELVAASSAATSTNASSETLRFPYWQLMSELSPKHSMHGRLLEYLSAFSNSTLGSAFVSIHQPINRSKVSFLANKTILIFGDSNERDAVDRLCSFISQRAVILSYRNASVFSERYHSDPHICEVPTLDLTVVFAMTMGVLIEPENERMWAHKEKNMDKPFAIEGRLQLLKVFMKTLDRYPDWILFSSNLWDLMYVFDEEFNAVATDAAAKKPLKHAEKAALVPWTWPERQIERWLSRMLDALGMIRSYYPNVPLYTRTLHHLRNATYLDFWNDARVAQLNEASFRLLELAAEADNGKTSRQRLDLRIIDLDRVLRGLEEREVLRDAVHLAWIPGQYMYIEMILEAILCQNVPQKQMK